MCHYQIEGSVWEQKTEGKGDRALGVTPAGGWRDGSVGKNTLPEDPGQFPATPGQLAAVITV